MSNKKYYFKFITDTTNWQLLGSCNIGISHNAKTSYKKMKIFKDI